MRPSKLNKNWVLLALLSLGVLGAAPSRVATYTAGQVISPSDVTANEDAIYQYLQSGVSVYVAGSVDTTAIANGTIAAVDLAPDAVTSAKILDGTITGSDVGSETLTTANVLDGTLVNADLSTSAAIAFSKLATLTAGNIVLGNASNVATSTALTGDMTVTSGGVTSIGNNKVTGAMIALGSDAQGDTMAQDGTDYVRIPKGTAGQVYTMNSVATAPTWTGAPEWMFVEDFNTTVNDATVVNSSTLPTDADVFKVVFDGFRIDYGASGAGAVVLRLNNNSTGDLTLATNTGTSDYELQGELIIYRTNDASASNTSVLINVKSVGAGAPTIAASQAVTPVAIPVTSIGFYLGSAGGTVSFVVKAHLYKLSKQL